MAYKLGCTMLITPEIKERFKDVTAEDILLLGNMIDKYYKDNGNFKKYAREYAYKRRYKDMATALHDYVNRCTNLTLLEMPLSWMPLFINSSMSSRPILGTFYTCDKQKAIAMWRLQVGL